MVAQMGSGPALIEVVGSLNIDVVTVTSRVPGPGETIKAVSFDTGFGGKGANQAVAAARLLRHDASSEPDHRIMVSMNGAVGDDQFGKDFVIHLKDVEKIGVVNVRAKKGYKTGTSCILVEEATGENRILFTEGANGALTPDEASSLEPTSEVGNRKHFVVLQMEIPIESMVACVQRAKAMGKEIIVNPAPAAPLPERIYEGLDHLIMNETEAAILSGVPEAEVAAKLPEVARKFLERGVRTVVVTLGSKGAYYMSRSGGQIADSHVVAQQIKAIDTTAAGDTWLGAYVVHLARYDSEHIAEAVNFANGAAARSVMRAGAQASMPYAGEVG